MQVIDVGQITAYIKDLVDSDPLLSDLWLRGEVTSFFESAAGHCYFTLSGDGCQIKAVLFKGQRWAVQELPHQGDEIVVHGSVSIYPDQGQYQIYVDYLAPEGTGLAQLQFEELFRRLKADGLFDESRKRPLPELPRTIGVVTSSQGAVWHDIQTVVRRRFPVTNLLLSPSSVQGADAPGQLLQALQALVDDGTSDVIIIARGGGSPEELAVFNDERLARAIFRSPIPIVSAIGHETDTTIADLVADLRAPTPSAAAELTVPDRREVLRAIAARLVEGREFVLEQVERCEETLKWSSSRLASRSPRTRIDRNRQSVDLLRLRSLSAIRRDLERRGDRLKYRTAHLESLSPHSVLRRGYAAIEDASSGARLSTVASIRRAPGDIRVLMQDGAITVRPAKEE
ncbi:MAG: exodeoxyribonuclease VII large subunit [Thermomicrobiales bacterium]